MSGKNVKTWAAVCIATVMLGQSDTSAQEEIDWTGWYGGAFGSYISGTLNSNDPSHRQSTGDYDEDSPMAGVSISYPRQYPSDWVAGVELMVPLYMQKGTAVDKQFFPDIVTYEASYRYGVLLSAKGGKSYGSALPYAIGGIGLTNVVGKTFNVDLNDQVSMGFEQSAAATHFIWQIGGGIDYRANEVMTLGARVSAFIAAKADHTMSWNEPGPNEFGYSSVLLQFNWGYRF